MGKIQIKKNSPVMSGNRTLYVSAPEKVYVRRLHLHNGNS